MRLRVPKIPSPHKKKKLVLCLTPIVEENKGGGNAGKLDLKKLSKGRAAEARDVCA